MEDLIRVHLIDPLSSTFAGNHLSVTSDSHSVYGTLSSSVRSAPGIDLVSACSPISSGASSGGAHSDLEREEARIPNSSVSTPSVSNNMSPSGQGYDHGGYFVQPTHNNEQQQQQQSQSSHVPMASRYGSSEVGPYGHTQYLHSAPTSSGVEQAAAAAYYAASAVTQNQFQLQSMNNANRLSRSPSVLQSVPVAREQAMRESPMIAADKQLRMPAVAQAPVWDRMPTDEAMAQQHRRLSQALTSTTPTSEVYEGVTNCICRSLGQTTCTCGASCASNAANKVESRQSSADPRSLLSHSPFTTTVQVPAQSYHDQHVNPSTGRYATTVQPGLSASMTAPTAQRHLSMASSGVPDTSTNFMTGGTANYHMITSTQPPPTADLSLQYPQSAHLYSSFPLSNSHSSASAASASTTPAMRHSTGSATTSGGWPSNATNCSATSSSSWSASNPDYRSGNTTADMSGSYFSGMATPTHAPAMTTSSSSDGGSQVHMSPYIDSRRGSGAMVQRQQQYYVPVTAPAYGAQRGGAAGVRQYEGTLGFDMSQLTSEVNMQYASEEARWDAVTRRSHAADSHFIYGALTTRIYCRPSCASKRPDRGRVQYFMFPNAAAKAEAAGFRACKRCKPGTPGTADVCVLAVGECLRHMTRAALLGESDEVDKRLRKRTLKQYSCDYGVSAFHFHRTLKSVSTLTPGEYSKAAHSLVLQDEIGMDRHGRALEVDELNRKLHGWSARRARRALGNVLPHIYATGLADVQTRYVSASTTFGTTVVLYALPDHTSGNTVITASGMTHPFVAGGGGATAGNDGEHPCFSVIAVLLGDDAMQRVMMRAPKAQKDDSRTQWLVQLVNVLAAKGTREVQMPREVIYWVRRARIYLATKNALEAPGSNANSSPSVARAGEGDPFDDEQFE